MKTRIRLFSFIAGMSVLAVFFGSCSKTPSALSVKPVIAVSILPQQYFVERIGADRVSALVLVGPGQDPHSYEPTPKQMADLSSALVWIRSGTDFETGLAPKVAALYPALKVVDGTEGVTFRPMDAEEAHEGEGADEHEGESAEEHEGESAEEHEGETAEEHHEHEGNIDRHTWLGKEPAKLMAGHIRDALSEADPAGKEVYDRNLAAVLQDIDATFGELAATLAPLSGKTVLVFHPAFGYFLDGFNIRQESVETGGKEPTAKALAALMEKAAAERPPAIFVQAQFPVNAAKNIADAVGAEVVMLDPLAGDWLANIKQMGTALAKGVRSDR